MPPSENEVLAVIDAMSARQPGCIFSREYLVKEIRAKLRTSSPYANKILGELGRTGRIKEIEVHPSGFLRLEDGGRPGSLLPYFHSRHRGDVATGNVTLDYPEGGNLWAGEACRSYYLSVSTWDSLKAELSSKADTSRKRDVESREMQRNLEEVALEELVPGYAEVRAALSALLPRVQVDLDVMSDVDERDPRIHVRARRLRLSELKAFVEILQKGLTA